MNKYLFITTKSIDFLSTSSIKEKKPISKYTLIKGIVVWYLIWTFKRLLRESIVIYYFIEWEKVKVERISVCLKFEFYSAQSLEILWTFLFFIYLFKSVFHNFFLRMVEIKCLLNAACYYIEFRFLSDDLKLHIKMSSVSMKWLLKLCARNFSR